MGGGQANSGQASQAASNANVSSKKNLAIGTSDQATAERANNTLLDRASGFLNPNALNVTTPTGAYKLNYEQAVKQTENESQGNQANIIRQAANNGLGLSSPAIAEMARRTGLDTANLKGQDFTQAVSQQHQDAVNNFWNAAQTYGGVGSSAGSNAVGATTGAGSTAANVYGTAGQYHASPITSIIGAGLQAGGAIGASAVAPGAPTAAAAACPAEGSLISTPKGKIKVEHLVCGDEISQKNNRVSRLKCTPIPHYGVRLFAILTLNEHQTLVGGSHSFIDPTGGYYRAQDARERFAVETESGRSILDRIRDAGIGTVYEIITEDENTNRTYCADSLWSLE